MIDIHDRIRSTAGWLVFYGFWAALVVIGMVIVYALGFWTAAVYGAVWTGEGVPATVADICANNYIMPFMRWACP